MYYQNVSDTLELENLFAGNGAHVVLENVSVKGGADIQRGMIICGKSGVYEPVTAAADANKPLAIAASDFNDTAQGVISAYTGGSFHANALKVGGNSVTVDDFKEALRKDNIILSNYREV